MKKIRIRVYPSCFRSEFDMIMSVPEDRDTEEYIDEVLDGLLDDDIKYNVEWEYTDGYTPFDRPKVKNGKRKWIVPVTWEMYGTIEIEANSPEDAIKCANEYDGCLPTDRFYVDDSWRAACDADELIPLS